MTKQSSKCFLISLPLLSQFHPTMPRGKKKEPKLPPALAGLDRGTQWTDISDSEVDSLPLLSKSVPLTNPRFLARSHHSHVYTIEVTYQDITARVILKLFPKALKHRCQRNGCLQVFVPLRRT